ncbi:LptM family lipoprotein [Photobacterium chitinilyticum]|uniref:Lipoprotein n=1 Tax=Photobacterium chitinilyticum TaxID=2485123 RepID=A0A444JSC0_9GAMM|nr:hypothetical protein [Photobacterium chitinilyticum]RWX56015.1 hypothetical protein EDI28_06900 [Photobacterium chitinilyticum]
MKILKGLAIAAMLVTLAGCGRIQPLRNVENTPVAYNLQITQVKQAIMEAGMRRNWVMMETKPGVIRAEYTARTHIAIVDIVYSDKTYSIDYVSSENLMYEDGKIHRNYNRWVNNLDVDIKKELAMVAQ